MFLLCREKGKTVIRKALHPLNDCRHWVDRAGPYTVDSLGVTDLLLKTAGLLHVNKQEICVFILAASECNAS